MPYNNFGCWDFRGYTDSKFDTNQGVQPKIIKAMVERVSAMPIGVDDMEVVNPATSLNALDFACIAIGVLALFAIIISLVK